MPRSVKAGVALYVQGSCGFGIEVTPPEIWSQGNRLAKTNFRIDRGVNRLSAILNLGNFCTNSIALAPGSGRCSMSSIQQDLKLLFGKGEAWQ